MFVKLIVVAEVSMISIDARINGPAKMYGAPKAANDGVADDALDARAAFVGVIWNVDAHDTVIVALRELLTVRIFVFQSPYSKGVLVFELEIYKILEFVVSRAPAEDPIIRLEDPVVRPEPAPYPMIVRKLESVKLATAVLPIPMIDFEFLRLVPALYPTKTERAPSVDPITPVPANAPTLVEPAVPLEKLCSEPAR